MYNLDENFSLFKICFAKKYKLNLLRWNDARRELFVPTSATFSQF